MIPGDRRPRFPTFPGPDRGDGPPPAAYPCAADPNPFPASVQAAWEIVRGVVRPESVLVRRRPSGPVNDR